MSARSASKPPIRTRGTLLPIHTHVACPIHFALRLPCACAPAHSVEKVIETGKSESVDIPFWMIGYSAVSVTFNIKLGFSVSGNLGGLTVTETMDLCVKTGAIGELCGESIPTCLNLPMIPTGVVALGMQVFCTAIGGMNLRQLMGNPPYMLMEGQMKFDSGAYHNSSLAHLPSSTQSH